MRPTRPAKIILNTRMLPRLRTTAKSCTANDNFRITHHNGMRAAGPAARDIFAKPQGTAPSTPLASSGDLRSHFGFVRSRISSSRSQLTLPLRAGQLVPHMDLPEEAQTFLRDLVKASRQKPHLVKWVDRDGSERHTALTQPEALRLNTLAHRLGLSKSELLRQAAHIPAAK